MRADKDIPALWREEERLAHVQGWDFSHLDGRWEEEGDLPWDYRETILRYRTPDMKILDVDTGGGEFMLSLGHPNANLAATEAYPPNVALCREKLSPLGVDFRPGRAEALPFEDECFDMVINRHGDFSPGEFWRVMKPGGLLITQQVGAENDRELVELLMPRVPNLPFPEQYLTIALEKLRERGFRILEQQESFRTMRFYDVGALVWFARIIEWEFPGFSVDSCADGLWKAQELVEAQGFVEGKVHRYYIVAQK